MRIRWIRLRHFRGIEERKLELPARGVTVVEGPNEIGKSSFVEALDLLFHHLDSTRKQAVCEVQPVGRDVGTEIEAEIESGPYVFTYFKRFFRRPETVLHVAAPRRETQTGRSAHRRALAILDETIDLDLWQALCIQQGTAVGQAPLARAKSLARALDEAAGREAADERDLSLYEAAESEYLAYFTPERGERRKALRDARVRVEDAARRVEALRGDLAALEEQVDRHARLEREILVADRARREAETRRETLLADLASLEKRERTRDALRLTLSAKQASEAVARRDAQVRRDLVRRAEEAAGARARLEHEAARRRPALREAETGADEAGNALIEAERDVEATAALLELRERDLDYHHAKLDLEQLNERRERIRRARAAAADAEARLKRIRVDNALLDRLRAAHLARAQAEARVEAASPRLRLTALTDLEARVDGEAATLAPGERMERTVEGRALVHVPGVAEIEVTAAADADALAAAREGARRAYAVLLDEAGVEDLNQAEAQAAARREAERVLAGTQRILDENLRDLTPQVMEEKISRLEAWVHAYPGERPVDPLLPPGFDAANDEKNKIKQAHQEAVEQLDRARVRRNDAAARAAELKERAHATELELRLAAEQERKTDSELAAARTKAADATISAQLEQAEQEARGAQHALAEEERALADAQPERVRRTLADARKTAAAAADRLRRAQDEMHQVTARLEMLGERGLYDQLTEAEVAHDHARREHEAAERHAAAARVLFETLRSRRESARRAYAEPLRRRIVDLGRTVFGTDFEVELDNELRIATRTLAGRTLPFASLSVGAREQLALVARLACALLIDVDQGVPLLFDDTLGHSDPGRLDGLAQMLAAVGERSQIVVMTCTPGRFRIPGSRRVRWEGALEGRATRTLALAPDERR